MLIKKWIPRNLKIIKFGDRFNNGDRPIIKDILPKNLKILHFGDKIYNDWPESLKILTFECYFNNGDFSPNHHALIFGDDFTNGGYLIKKEVCKKFKSYWYSVKKIIMVMDLITTDIQWRWVTCQIN